MIRWLVLFLLSLAFQIIFHPPQRTPILYLLSVGYSGYAWTRLTEEK